MVIDGRADVYGDQFLHDFADTDEFKDHWQERLNRWRVQTVLVPPDSALATGLHSAPGWTVSFEDAMAVILTRSPLSIAKIPLTVRVQTPHDSQMRLSALQSPSVCKKLHPSQPIAGYYCR